MKFIYSLMLITFLMTTFTSETGWGGVAEEASAQCVKEIGPNKGNDKNWAASYEACLKRKGVRQTSEGNYVQSYHYDNDKYKTCAAKYKTTADVDKCMSKGSTAKTPAAKPPATKAPVADNAKGDPCQGKTGQAFAAGGKCECQTGYTAESGKTPLSCVKDEAKNSATVQCNGRTTTFSCTCEAPKIRTEVVGKFAAVNGNVGDAVKVYDCAAAAAPAPQPEYEEDGSNCLVTYQKLVATCKQDAQTAVNKCDLSSEENKSNSDFAGLGDLLKGASAMAVKSKSGSGAYESCLNTALTTQAGFFAAEELNTSSCDPAVKQCKTSCEVVKNEIEENRENIVNNCVDLAMKKHISENGQFDEEMPESRFVNINTITFQQALDQIATELEAGQDDCGVDAVSLQNKLKQTANDFNNAAKQAQVCRCQTGSTGEDCNEIKGPAQCVLNPNAAGCALSTVNCNNSNSIQCRCLKNPNLAECKTGGGGRESGLVGKPFSTPSSSIGSNVAPKINNGDLDIAFADEASNAGASGTEGSATSPFGSAQASGGGGGGANGAGAGTGEGDPAADAEGGLKALLDKPKGFIGGMLNKLGFGGGNSADKKYGKDSDGKKIDPNKWKPGMLRGVAGNGSEIGPKHRDIWKAMNSQYFLQEKTFLQEK